jgi:hypothetical protein
MSDVARWSYTAPATIWRKSGEPDEYGVQPWAPPEVIMCDYIGGLSAKVSDLGKDISVKNTFFTEFSEAGEGDYIKLGVSDEPDPVKAGADAIRAATQWGDTFERVADDYAIITGT